MSVQITIRLDDELAAFVNQAAHAGEGSRADVINRAIRRELRRRAVRGTLSSTRPRRIMTSDPDAYAAWASRNADQVWSELD